MLNYQRLAAAGGLVPGPGGVPLGVYPEGMSAYLSGIAADQPPFYANPVSERATTNVQHANAFQTQFVDKNKISAKINKKTVKKSSKNA